MLQSCHSLSVAPLMFSYSFLTCFKTYLVWICRKIYNQHSAFCSRILKSPSTLDEMYLVSKHFSCSSLQKDRYSAQLNSKLSTVMKNSYYFNHQARKLWFKYKICIWFCISTPFLKERLFCYQVVTLNWCWLTSKHSLYLILYISFC